LGICFKLESVDWTPSYLEEMIPFKLTYFLEDDGINEVDIENVRVHRRGYRWYNRQHLLIPYWRMNLPSGPGVSEYYFGLFMSSEGQLIGYGDWLDGNINNAIIKGNSGYRKDMYEILPLNGVLARVADTQFLSVEYPYNKSVQVSENGTNKDMYPAYCRILVQDYETAHIGNQVYQYVNDSGFPDIVKVTAEKAYKRNCGDFREKLLVTVDFDPGCEIDVGTKVNFEGKSYVVERMSGIDIENQEVVLEMVVLD